MIKRLFEQIVGAISETESSETDPAARDKAIRRATAVLMLDVALADKVFNQSELDHLRAIAQSHFGLGPAEASELIEEARNEAEELVSLHEFTQLLHQHMTEDEKATIIGMLWQIAYADGKLDKYENSLVLRISDLLYVSRGRVMRLKHDAARAANP
ncbi:MAG TPA: TerB family tellurite resistance protein [Woeseiaceae bacterium]